MRTRHFLAGLGLVVLCRLAAVAGQPAAAGGNEVYVVPFSHLDLFWAGTREECLSRGNFIIAKAVQIALRQPEFRFLLEDDVFVENYRQTRRGTAELETFKRLVRAGRIEIAAKWAGIYQNLPRGEALVRNHLYGKRYAREVFGVDPQVSHLGDLPGYTSQYPQILAKAGIPFMVMTRMGPPDCSLFRWCAPDGSRALVWYSLKGYGWGIGLGLHQDLDASRLTRVVRELDQVRATTKGPIYLGWGTDLWAPSEKLVDNVAFLNHQLAPTAFHLATPDEYFTAASKTADVPELSGEIPSSWANIIASLCHLWAPAMAATDMLVTAEKFAAINHALGYAAYPQAELESLWKLVLQAMDHNNFGQGGFLGDARRLQYTQVPALRAGEILRDMLRNVAERVRIPVKGGTPMVVFNPLSWMRDDVVRTHVSLYGDVRAGDIPKVVRLADEMGAPVPFYEEQSYGTVSRAREIVFLARGVPPLGYKTYFLVPANKAEDFPNACQLKLDVPDPEKPKRLFGYDELENACYRVTVDRATGQITVFDKELDRVVVQNLEMVATEVRGGDTLSKIPRSGRVLPNTVSQVELEENNPVRTVVRLQCDLAGVPITQRLFLYAGLKRIDLENTVDWKANKFLQLEQLFPYTDPQAKVRYGIPFGSAADTDLFPKCGPHAGDEVPYDEWKTWRQIQDWIYAGTAEGGLTIAADRQFMMLGEGVIRAGMLRGAFQSTGITRAGKPSLLTVPPAGTYVFRYSLSSAKGTWAAAKSYRAGMAFNTPLIPVSSVDPLAQKPLPPTHSFCSLAAENLVVSAVKKAERDGAIVLRLFEMEGTRAQTPVEFLGRKTAVRAVNLLEEEDPAGAQEILRVKPYEISTVRLVLK
ncbi:MAG: glycosyl hydrolase-related protein [Planctomycetes bacterium]|nr:glycosyl hydrolase-related protein [Planctomycetota bacterium]